MSKGPWLKDKDAIELLGLEDLGHPVKKLHALYRTGKLAYGKVGRSYRTRADWIDAYILIHGSAAARKEAEQMMVRRIEAAQEAPWTAT